MIPNKSELRKFRYVSWTPRNRLLTNKLLRHQQQILTDQLKEQQTLINQLKVQLDESNQKVMVPTH
jgi:hypothetical protein